MVLMMNAQPSTYKPFHPSYEEMIFHAICSLKRRNGSSSFAIAKFILKHYGGLPKNFRKILLHRLKELVACQKLIRVKNSFKLPSQ
uniref:H15 domain-containing protein n=1 Tax=Daucus carota subsp. sativus TaxID=79200 RepID=A0A161ZRK9_DAUCS